MGLFDFFFRKGERTIPENQFYQEFFQELRSIGAKITAPSFKAFIEKGYNFNPHAYTTVSYKARQKSRVSFELFEVKNEKALKNFKACNNPIEKRLFKNEALEKNETSALAELLKNPNEFDTWADFMFEGSGFSDITGNSFVYGLTPAGFPENYFTKIYQMPPQAVDIVPGDALQPVKGYSIDERFSLIGKDFIDCDKVMHLKNFNPNKKNNEGNFNFYGLSPMEPLLRSLDRSNESYSASLALLQNGGPAGMISPKGDRLIKPDDLKKLEKAWNAKFAGGKNKGKWLKSGVEMLWQQIGQNSTDLELLDSNKADLADFARAYGIPLELLGNADSKYKNKEEAKKSVWEEVLIPELTKLRDGLNLWLVPGHSEFDGKQYFIDYNISNIASLQADLNTLSARLLAEWAAGLWTRNQVLIMMDKEPSKNPIHDLYIYEIPTTNGNTSEA